MAAINFPNSPSIGTPWTENGVSWVFDGQVWVGTGTSVPGSSGSGVPVGHVIFKQTAADLEPGYSLTGALGVPEFTSPDADYVAVFPVGGTVAAPVFDTPAGEVADDTVVNFPSATPGATVRYTTNGDTPSRTVGTIGTSATVSDPMTIKAIAYLDEWMDSSVAEAAYTVQVVQAFLLEEDFGASGYQNGDWTVSGTWNPSYSALSLDGTHSLRVTSTNVSAFKTFTAQPEAWFYGQIYADASSWGAATATGMMQFRNSAGTNVLSMRVTNDGSLSTLVAGNVANGNSAASLFKPGAKRLVHVWLHYIRNGTGTVYASYNGVRPTEDSATGMVRTIACPDFDVDRVAFVNNSEIMIYDRARVSMTPIGSNADPSTSVMAFSDDFNRTNGSLGDNWTTTTGLISNNTVIANAAAMGVRWIGSGVPFTSRNQYAQLTMVTKPNASLDIRLRATDDTERVLATFDTSGNTVTLYRRVASSNIIAAGAVPCTLVNGDVIRIEVVGPTICVKVNGIVVREGGDITGVGDGTTAGFGINSTGAIDNFEAGILV
jgi:hypothetical protein